MDLGVLAKDSCNISLGNILMKIIVDETDWCRAAACKALDEFYAVFPIGTGGQAVVTICSRGDTRSLAELLAKFMTAGHGTRERTADAYDRPSRCVLAKPRIECDKL